MTVSTAFRNHELFVHDPLTTTIPNLGVAKVGEPTTPEEWRVLEYELGSFVCEGAYHNGLALILQTFLGALDKAEQPAAWVSGFYGSGKSHFTRVLEYLWRDVELPGGAKARGLVHLPNDVKDLLVELSTQARRRGGIWSAAGTLGAGARGSVRMALLNLIYRGAGLPENYAEAGFVLWLKEAGLYDAVSASLVSSGRSLLKETRNLYVSDPLANALLAAQPTFAGSSAEARGLIKAQFPQRQDISDDEMVRAMEAVFGVFASATGKRPLVLLVFDELQQFIGDSADRAFEVQGVVEACSARFGSSVLFVGTGQSALQATPQLARLQGRFTVKVALEDADVEKVVREVVLQKRADRVKDLQDVLDHASGEIDRHLAGAPIKPTVADKPFLVADYPLLPTRRRFWESVLRAVDSLGNVGQLRTQLRIVHETTRDVGNEALGVVVPADAIYWQIRSDLLQSGVLPRDLDKAVNELDDATPDGKLASRLAGVIFLIGKLEPVLGGAPDVTATADTLADLLVTDLNAGSASIRADVKRVLDDLVTRGKLMEVSGTYRLQTREGMEWEAEYARRASSIRTDESRIGSDRAQELRQAVAASVKGLTFVHGASKTKRTMALHYDLSAPPKGTDAVQVWVRDEWNTPLSTVRTEAAAAGTSDPTVYVWLPKVDPEPLRQALIAYAAATQTIDGTPPPTTQAGQDARAAMVSRQQHARSSLDALVGAIVSGARILQGGGTEVVELSFVQGIRRAVEASFDRLFPQFGTGDFAAWGTVVQRAAAGSPDPLAAIGHTTDADKQPACKLILLAIPAGGKRGLDLRKQFMGAPYGWPQEAVDGALMALLASDMIRATRNGEVVGPKQLGHGTIGQTDFASQTVVLSGSQKLELRKLCQDFGFPATADQLGAVMPRVLLHLREQAKAAGGDPPFPAPPDASLIEGLQGKAGNEQLAAVHAERDELRRLSKEWQAAATTIAGRQPEWDQLTRLLKHADGSPEEAIVRPQVDAIRTGRTGLAEPDPMRPLVDTLSASLRTGVMDAYATLTSAHSTAMADLEASEEWQKLAQPDRDRLVATHGLQAPSAPSTGTVDALLAALDTTPLATLRDRATTLPARAAAARAAAAKLLEPKAVALRLKSATLHDAAELDTYLAELRSEITVHLSAGCPVIVQ